MVNDYDSHTQKRRERNTTEGNLYKSVQKEQQIHLDIWR